MSEQEAAWAALSVQACQIIVDCKTREELREATQSPAYLALKACERGHFYEQVKAAAIEKAATYKVVAMSGITLILRDNSIRARAKAIIDKAPADAVVNVREASRNADQNARMWAMLSDVAIAKPEGRMWTTDTWKAAFMHALGHQCQFAEGLDGSGPFPVGFRTSRLSVRQMADLITVIQEYGDRHGVKWTEPELRGAA